MGIEVSNEEISNIPVIDEYCWAQLVRLLRTGRVQHFVSVDYLGDAGELLQVIKTAALMGDFEVAVIAAHRLKSSSAIVGAAQLSELCRLLEEDATTGRRQPLITHVRRIEGAFKLAREELLRRCSAL